MITLETRQVLIASAGFFGLLGLRRGVSREVLAMAGIIFGHILLRLGGDTTVRLINQIRSQPPLITEGQAPQFVLGIYAVVVLGSYALGQFVVKKPESIESNLIGLLAGLVNGYLIAFFVLPQVVSEEGGSVDVTVPAGQIVDFLNENWIYSVVGIVLVLMLLGLRSSR